MRMLSPDGVPHDVREPSREDGDVNAVSDQQPNVGLLHSLEDVRQRANRATSTDFDVRVNTLHGHVVHRSREPLGLLRKYVGVCVQ